jgi:hypothetical protein
MGRTRFHKIRFLKRPMLQIYESVKIIARQLARVNDIPNCYLLAELICYGAAHDLEILQCRFDNQPEFLKKNRNGRICARKLYKVHTSLAATESRMYFVRSMNFN